MVDRILQALICSINAAETWGIFALSIMNVILYSTKHDNKSLNKCY